MERKHSNIKIKFQGSKQSSVHHQHAVKQKIIFSLEGTDMKTQEKGKSATYMGKKNKYLEPFGEQIFVLQVSTWVYVCVSCVERVNHIERTNQEHMKGLNHFFSSFLERENARLVLHW